METVGYKLIEIATGIVVQDWGGVWGQCPAVPNPIYLPNGDVVYAPSLDTEYNGYMLVQWMMDPPPPAVPEFITRRQCALQLLAIGMISDNEAVEMVRSGIPPASVQAYINAMPSQADRTRAEIDFAASAYYRSNPLLIAMMEANGSTPEDIDAFFIAAAQF